MTDTKVALITGAGMGIGKAIAQRLANDGFSVAVNDVSLDTAEATTTELRVGGATTVGVQADVSDRDQVFAMVAQVVDQLGINLFVAAEDIQTRSICSSGNDFPDSHFYSKSSFLFR